ncbi:hypothetical protein PR048_020610 [Dryococelus australis]|uniref:Uncharacterized protein n=1 Tax=Dryococelus australis TaxID=614101 RepID=A0ABQ9H6T4_9NEOP|nr:hypothetical protein PR048_020610 [Dryococelus australis]
MTFIAAVLEAILERFNAVSEKLQSEEMDVGTHHLIRKFKSSQQDEEIKELRSLRDFLLSQDLKVNAIHKRKIMQVLSCSSVIFSFLSHLTDTDPDQIYKSADILHLIYPSDIEETFGTECIYVTSFLLQAGTSSTYLHKNKLLMFKNLYDLHPNVQIALKIYLCTPVQPERCFSAPAKS